MEAQPSSKMCEGLFIGRVSKTLDKFAFELGFSSVDKFGLSCDGQQYRLIQIPNERFEHQHNCDKPSSYD